MSELTQGRLWHPLNALRQCNSVDPRASPGPHGCLLLSVSDLGIPGSVLVTKELPQEGREGEPSRLTRGCFKNLFLLHVPGEIPGREQTPSSLSRQPPAPTA